MKASLALAAPAILPLAAEIRHDPANKTWTLKSGAVEYRLQQFESGVYLQYFGPPGQPAWKFNFRVSEAKTVEFRTLFCNSLNHANLRNPDAKQSSPSFGRISGASTPRVVEFGLKFSFLRLEKET